MVQLERICGWHDILCTLLEQGQPLAMACANANVPMTRVFNEQKNDSKFKTRVERAMKYGRGERSDDGGIGGGINQVRTVSPESKD